MLDKTSSFIGSVPEFYERYLVPMHFEAHARIMVDRLGELRSGHLLEIAAGTGAVTRLLARELRWTPPVGQWLQPHLHRGLRDPVGHRRHTPSELHYIPIDLWVRLKSFTHSTRGAASGLSF